VDAVIVAEDKRKSSRMKVNPNHEVPSTAPLTAKAKPAAHSNTTDAPDFAATNKLAQQLASTPDIRTDEVARAKALIADPTYPDDKIIRAVARQLADKIGRAPIQIPTANLPKES
jgi:Anti-sigma-28 factor, FlgM